MFMTQAERIFCGASAKWRSTGLFSSCCQRRLLAASMVQHRSHPGGEPGALPGAHG